MLPTGSPCAPLAGPTPSSSPGAPLSEPLESLGTLSPALQHVTWPASSTTFPRVAPDASFPAAHNPALQVPPSFGAAGGPATPELRTDTPCLRSPVRTLVCTLAPGIAGVPAASAPALGAP